jgi:hypothetical protein
MKSKKVEQAIEPSRTVCWKAERIALGRDEAIDSSATLMGHGASTQYEINGSHCECTQMTK